MPWAQAEASPPLAPALPPLAPALSAGLAAMLSAGLVPVLSAGLVPVLPAGAAPEPEVPPPPLLQALTSATARVAVMRLRRMCCSSAGSPGIGGETRKALRFAPTPRLEHQRAMRCSTRAVSGARRP